MSSNSEVKQAAERLRIADNHGIDLAAMLTTEGIDRQLVLDLITVMRAYLAEHADDDDLPLHPDWLDTQDADCAYWPVGDGSLEFTRVGESGIEPGFKLRTRGQFRQLKRLLEALRGA